MFWCFELGDLRCLVGLVMLVVGFGVVCLGGLPLLFIVWLVCLFCWISLCGRCFIMAAASVWCDGVLYLIVLVELFCVCFPSLFVGVLLF